MNIRRLLFWSFLIAAMVAGLLWILHVPYKPDTVFAAIPSEATFVSVHDNLASELDALLKNQLVRNAILAAGAGEKDLNELASNAVTRAWISRLAADRSVVAYVPALGHQRKPAWVFASWIGNHSQRFRWKLFWFRPGSIREIGAEYGRVIYGVRTQPARPKARLSLSLTEGVLVGCLSEDPAAARYLVQAFDRQYGRASVLSDGTLAGARSLAGGDPALWGWIKQPRNLLPPRDRGALLVYKAGISKASQLKISLASPGILPDAGNLAQHPSAAPFQTFLGSAPDGLLVFPVSWLRLLLPDPQTRPLWLDSLQPLMDTTNSSALCFITVLNRDHCGRIRGPLGDSLTPFVKGLRVPTALIGIQVADEQDASQRINLILDQLNSRYRLGLIPHPVPAPTGTVTLVEETRKNLYGKFEPDERVAWTFRDGWLHLASNAAILKRLMAAQPAPTGFIPGYAPWINSSTPASAALWMNTDTLGKLLKDALSAVTLSLMVRNAEGTRETRRQLEAARQWVDKTKGISQVSALAYSTNGIVSLDLTLTTTSSSASPEE